MVRPTVEEILAHPTYPSAVWKFKPAQSGKLPVAGGRGGPFKLHWEVHGTGDIKIVWVMGLGAIMSAWQRQTHKFGHLEGNRYSCLIYDNRGIGLSDVPVMRYSTSEMAKDVIEIIDHVGWTSERQLHIYGVSMGGMISQEIATLIPNRIASLSLVSTAARIENTTTFIENITTRVNMVIPKSLNRSITDAARALFPDYWLDAPDGCIVPTASTPGVILPPTGEYGMFSTNYERFAAQELSKRLDPDAFTKKGFLLQLIAAGWHHKSPAQLKALGDAVGRERILVMHGAKDQTITAHHGHVLIRELEPGTSHILEKSGHVLILELTEWHDKVVEAMVAKTEAMRKK